ncbi:MAG: hypothetical protein D3925_00030 [Candidatus Electrothrix sp. AR5]|nr:hypothetical protein [Candidatus Electrothrix sp. AR5]
MHGLVDFVMISRKFNCLWCEKKMKFRFTLLFFALSSLIFICEVVFNCDLIKIMYTLHSSSLDRCVSVAFLGVTGLVIDYVVGIKKKKEQEKVAAYNATMRAANQLMRDLMNSMVILSASEAVQKEFGDDITEIIKRNTKKMEEVLEALTGLKEITPEMIREISDPTER